MHCFLNSGINCRRVYVPDIATENGTEDETMNKTAFEIKTEALCREIKAHGVTVLRYRIAYPILAGCEAINDFYRQTAHCLQEYAEKTANIRSEKLAACSRLERAGFREIMLRSVPKVVWADDMYVSILLDFIAADKEKIHRMVRTAHTFDLSSGRVCMPSEFLGRRKNFPSDDFYLTEKGLVFVVNLTAPDLSMKGRIREDDFIKEVIFNSK